MKKQTMKNITVQRAHILCYEYLRLFNSVGVVIGVVDALRFFAFRRLGQQTLLPLIARVKSLKCEIFCNKVLKNKANPDFFFFQGHYHRQPRLTAWFGDFPYEYSGLTLKPFQVSLTNIQWDCMCNIFGKLCTSNLNIFF